MPNYAAALLDKAKNSVSPANYSGLAARLGVSRQYVSSWKNGQEPIPEKYIAQLCRLAHVDESEWWLLLQLDQAKATDRARVMKLVQRLGIAAAVTLCAIALPYLFDFSGQIAGPMYIMFVVATLTAAAGTILAGHRAPPIGASNA